MEAITGGEPVWFGCDVGQMHAGEQGLGLWHADLYDYDGLYATTSTMTKADRLEHHGTAMTHAMLLTGVDVVDGPDGPAPRRWRVENSWGSDKGTDGFWTMDGSWFGEHVFEIAVRRDRLPARLQARLGDEPIVLPAWDPMGALAR
jgi:bleomycin hydrolase